MQITARRENRTASSHPPRLREGDPTSLAVALAARVPQTRSASSGGGRGGARVALQEFIWMTAGGFDLNVNVYADLV
ncbi:hypothetical protein ONZ51_g11872 [Trametes cubensis]|uniref:Uncharacterized protein n=1 Tax=Trametes cubensis TaxID=1111947 RepID=A0AAD7THP2_9APHY|nr:hypothetical protein ONZ51_g11872 [Trametes cubensis]